jgi:hypothetical protein
MVKLTVMGFWIACDNSFAAVSIPVRKLAGAASAAAV